MIEQLLSILKIKLVDLTLKSKLEKTLFSFFAIIILFFIIIHSLSVLGVSVNHYYSKDLLRITSDGSYAEYFQYMLLLGICYFIILISLIEKKYFLFLPFFFYLFLDDFFRFHDSYSVYLSLFPNIKLFLETLSSITTIRIKDWYEFTFHLFPLCLFLISMLILKFENVDKVFIKKYFFSIMCLIFFAIIVDILGLKLIEIINISKHPINTVIYFLEEGGEMITCSYIFVNFLNFYLNFSSKLNQER